MPIPPNYQNKTPLPILYLDESIAVVDKPAWLLTTPSNNPQFNDNVVQRIRKRFPWAKGPITPHRLDMATSGVLALALNPKAHRHLSIQFANREAQKTYIAILNGIPQRDRGTIKLPLRGDPENRPRQVVDCTAGKNACTRYEVLSHDNTHTRIKFRPITGRTHQLRVHAAHPQGLGCPILGDRLYGSSTRSPRLYLHAQRLVIRHPVSEEDLEIISPLPF